MHTFAVIVAYGLYLLVIAGAIWLAIVAVFWLPDRLLGFKRVEGVIVVPCATIALWLLLSYLAVPIPGILDHQSAQAAGGPGAHLRVDLVFHRRQLALIASDAIKHAAA
jgi:hypothetical protein